MRYLLLALLLTACETLPTVPDKPLGEHVKPVTEFGPCVKNFERNEHVRKAPPLDFLQDLFAFVSSTCGDNELYGRNSEPRDAFSHLSGYLGINGQSEIKHRCAAMFELMRVSAAMESSFNWQQGRDKSASNYTYYTMESGIFQTSPNSHIYAHKGTGYQRWEYLDKLVAPYLSRRVHINDEAANKEWNLLMKDEGRKDVIFTHHAFLLRHNYRHYGPVIDPKRVGENIDKGCIQRIREML